MASNTEQLNNLMQSKTNSKKTTHLFTYLGNQTAGSRYDRTHT